VLASLIASCKDNGVEPWAYLRDIFTRMARQPSDDELKQLLPDRWLAVNPDHRWKIAEQRRQERTATL
jgi:transposase